MSQEAIKNILSFLSRVDLKGNEALLFADCVQELNKQLVPEAPVETKAPEPKLEKEVAPKKQ